MGKDTFEGIMTGLQEALAYARGEADRTAYRVHPAPLDVRSIRKRTGLTQRAFADRFGFPPAALRQWERGVGAPEGTARVLLLVTDRNPGAVMEALAVAAK